MPTCLLNMMPRRWIQMDGLDASTSSLSPSDTWEPPLAATVSCRPPAKHHHHRHHRELSKATPNRRPPSESATTAARTRPQQWPPTNSTTFETTEPKHRHTRALANGRRVITTKSKGRKRPRRVPFGTRSSLHFRTVFLIILHINSHASGGSWRTIINDVTKNKIKKNSNISRFRKNERKITARYHYSMASTKSLSFLEG